MKAIVIIGLFLAACVVGSQQPTDLLAVITGIPFGVVIALLVATRTHRAEQLPPLPRVMVSSPDVLMLLPAPRCNND